MCKDKGLNKGAPAKDYSGARLIQQTTTPQVRLERRGCCGSDNHYKYSIND